MWGALPRGPLHLRLCNFAGHMDSMVGCWGSWDWGLVGFSVAVVLPIWDVSSCGARAACSFGGLLVVGHIISPCDWVCNLCFSSLGVLMGFSWMMGYGAFALGTMSDGVGGFPLLYTYMCLH